MTRSKFIRPFDTIIWKNRRYLEFELRNCKLPTSWPGVSEDENQNVIFSEIQIPMVNVLHPAGRLLRN